MKNKHIKNKQLKRFLLVLICLVCFINTYAQENTEIAKNTFNKEISHYLGLNAGFTTGIGLSYIFWPNKNGFQLTFLPLISKEEKRYSLAFTYLRYLTTNNKVNLLVFCGNHVNNFLTKSTSYNIGLGPGIQGDMGPFVYHFMIGYAISDVLDDYSTAVALEFGVFYKF